ncbi:MAG: hypothetical protein JW855_04640 [Gammaproteobacteria bacterium]|nr:hypothetical protein [Gammaproteobacteria bacterium]
MSKYDPLRYFLSNLSPTNNEITLSFEQINKILEAELPKSAYEYSAWWSNEIDGQHVQAHSWQDAGWKVESVDFNRKRVRFIRN